MKKMSLLAAAITVALTGCGSDDSSTASATTTNKFIDAAVEGMYYSTSSGLNGTTDSEGQFTSGVSDTVTFYIGGENGLKVGAASNRDVLTPFEAAGKYARALNLAILLQSLDESTGDDLLSIPAELQNPSQATLELLSQVSLDDRASVTTFITAMGATPVDESAALTHMETAFGSMTRGDTSSNAFTTAGKYVRYIDVTQNSAQFTYVHADKTMEETLFERTRGMTEMTYLVNSADSITELAGANDYSLSESYAEQYLTCVANASSQWVDNDSSNKKGCDTDRDGQVDTENGNLIADSKFELGNTFAYMLRDSDKGSTADKDYSGEDITGWKPFDATKASELNHYTPNNVWDDGENGSANWIRDTTSGSFDPVTGIYTEIVKKETLGSDANNAPSRTTERVAYYYEVPSADAERYVNFTGTWETTEICDDGQQAVMTMVFGSDVALSGYECSGPSGDTAPEPIEEDGMTTSYADLGAIDYWWFGQSGRESKATLTELNTVVRFCDQDNYVAGNACNSGEFFVKWEYQPAGTNWDEGLLIRHKMDVNGDTDGRRPSIMQKVN